jgi:hypothetical protein
VSDEDLVALAAELFTQCPQSEHRVLLAILERAAAAQYRRWASQVGDEQRDGMLACARREEEVAAVLEGRAPNAAETARGLMERLPDLPARYRSLLEGKGLGRQLAIQAEGERAGAALLRAYADAETDAVARDALRAAAELEEENARVGAAASQELPS